MKEDCHMSPAEITTGRLGTLLQELPIEAPLAERFVPLPHEGPPFEVQARMIDEIARLEKERIAAQVTLRDAMTQLREEYRRDFTAALGTKALSVYKQAKAKASQHRETIRVLGDHAGTPADRQEMNRAIVAELETTLAQQKVDTAKIKRIQEAYKAKALAVIRELVKFQEPAEKLQVLATVVMMPLVSTSQQFVAPFAGQGGSTHTQFDAGTCYAYHHENFLTGALETYTNLKNDDADDSDSSTASATAELRIWFRMPFAARVELTAYLKALQTSYGGWMADEWGISDAQLGQYSHLFARIQDPSGAAITKYKTLVNYTRGEQEGSWTHEAAEYGAILPLQLTSTQLYPAGEWLLCSVGLNDYNYFWLNDESCRSYIQNKLVLQQVTMRAV